MLADFSRLTVVTVTGEDGAEGGEAAVPSLVHSAAQLRGCRALMISPERPACLPPHIEHQRVKPFGYIGYSLFMLYALEYFIDTDFALVVQKDGWVLSADNWREDFYDCDYIGAPSVAALTINAAGDRSVYDGYVWQGELGRADLEVFPVYNGGFSLRSKRLLGAPRRLGLSMDIQPPSLVHSYEGKEVRREMHWPWGHHAEDAQLCMYMRGALTADGLRFAPLDVALDFSFEYLGAAIHADHDLSRTFGAHCKLRKFLGGAPPDIEWTGTAADLERVYRQAEVNEFLKTHYHYNIRV